MKNIWFRVELFFFFFKSRIKRDKRVRGRGREEDDKIIGSDYITGTIVASTDLERITMDSRSSVNICRVSLFLFL